MVKGLDDLGPIWPDHLGWRLWEANRDWQHEFVLAMQAGGHSWFTHARAGLLGNIGMKGTKQSVLVEKGDTTKQAIQQLLDGLEAEEIIIRVADPHDRRARMICLTDKGIAAMRDGNRIKNEIDGAYRKRIGDERFDILMAILRDIHAGSREP